MSLKRHQEARMNDVASIFVKGRKGKQYKKMLKSLMVEKTHAHGRHETRRYTLISARDTLAFHLRWPGLNRIGSLETQRTVNEKTERSVRYFLTRLRYEDIVPYKRALRKHWEIEINLHWSLGVRFCEDLNRCRAGNAAEQLARIRRVALNMLKKDKVHKRGISCRRKRAGWDNEYLLKVLLRSFAVNAGQKEPLIG